MIFCPTHYWGTGDDDAYLATLSEELHKDVFVFWTGPQVVSQLITREQAESYRKAVGHRLFIWDNYPVNDGSAALHLGPVISRGEDLCEVVHGYMSNPLHKESQINRIPMFTCADYAYNPVAYDPARSVGQAIVHLAEADEQRRVLKDLVEAYPGMLLHGGGAAANPVRHQFNRLLAMPHARYVADAYVRHLEGLSTRLARAFPDQFPAARKTLDADLAWLREALTGKYGR